MSANHLKYLYITIEPHLHHLTIIITIMKIVINIIVMVMMNFAIQINRFIVLNAADAFLKECLSFDHSIRKVIVVNEIVLRFKIDGHSHQCM